MLTKLLQFTIRACAIALLCSFALSATESRGVVKFGGLPVPGATVTATQGDKKFTAITDDQGLYVFPNLTDGVWKLHIEMQTFAPLDEEIAVAPNAPVPEWSLKLLPMSEIKPTVAPPPSATTASSAAASSGSATASASASNQQLQAGSQPAANGKSGKKNKKNAQEQAANPPGGYQRADVNASGAAQPPAEPTESVAGAASDQQGASDAMIVNGSTSTGIERRAIGNARRGPGSLFRGDVMVNLDNSYLDARNFSLTGQDTPRQAYNHLRFGGSIGGPLYIPHLLHGNGQFFVNYTIARNRNASTAPGLMPDSLERTGDFSNAVNLLGQPLTIYDPTSGAPFPGNVIPQNRFSSQALALLKYYPQPNFLENAGYNYQVPLIGHNNQSDITSRINRMLSRKDFLNGGFAYRNGNTVNPSIFNFNDTNDLAGLNGTASWRHMFNQRMNMLLTYTYNRYSVRNTPYFENRVNVSGDAGITGNNQDPLYWGPPSLSFNSSGIYGLSDGNQSFTRADTSSVSAVFLMVHRPHNIQYGVDLHRQQFNYLSQQNPRGSFGFTGAATQDMVNGVGVPNTGSDFADFLLGIPDTSSIAYGNADKYFRAWMDDAYFMDDWRVATGLTLNIGARWEYGSPITEKYGRLVNLDLANGFGAASPVVGSSPVGPLSGAHYPSSLVNPYRNGFEPRISFAWHPLFGSSLVMRGGYGVYYNTSVFQPIAIQMAQQSPLSKSLNIQNSAASPLTLANGFYAPPNVLTNTFAVDPNFRPGYSQNWQLSAQRDISEGIVMTVTYLGIKGTRAPQEFVPNTYPAGAVNPCPSCPAGFVYLTSNGNSTREAGSLQIQRRFHNGISANVIYTYSKAIDDAALGGRGQGSTFIAQNWLDLSAERALSNFDQRHNVTIQAQYSTGVGVRGGALMKGWRGVAFKGWTITTNVSAGSGLPETPIYPSAINRTGISGPIRPDYTGAFLYNAPAGYFLNPAAFAAPLAGQWGTAGRDSIIGPNQFSLNASMARTFKDSLDLRIDTTNALNHVVFASYNVTTTSSQFGLPASPNGMRDVQLTLRWRF